MIGEKLVTLRKQRGLSQEEVANRLNVSRQTISNWENNQAIPTIDKAKELSKLYNVSMDELLENESVNKEYKISSNTEKLAGIIITMFKIALVLIILYIFIMFIAVLVRNHNINKEKNYKSFAMNCYLEEQEYYISHSEGPRGITNYSCRSEECDSNVLSGISNIIYTSSTIDEKKDQIKIYFVNNDGFCEEI